MLFDLDDTLHDRSGSLRLFLADQHSRHLAGRCDGERFADRFLSLDANGHLAKAVLYPRLLEEFGIGDLSADALAEDYNSRFCLHARPVDGAAEVLRLLRDQGLKLAIISNGWTDFQRLTIDAIGVAGAVDLVLISEAEGLRKPDSRLFLRAAEQLGVGPADCLHVGDNPDADILGAHATGMQAAWFRRGFDWPLGKPMVGIEINALADILALIARRC